eukprot:TRINITY_DN5751_c0_g2_i6.p1 TRINITY_DN5751_c0_g2~~TRINITY_DN5751_c0_g2_i6.p1  ORF type:complete len:296 (-),score=65.76 TRINITY_DN5751_c0_g2_i6:169-1056(-)
MLLGLGSTTTTAPRFFRMASSKTRIGVRKMKKMTKRQHLNEQVQLFLSSPLASIAEEATHEEKTNMGDVIQDFKSLIERTPPGALRASTNYGLFEKFLVRSDEQDEKITGKARNISCKKGCNHCCHRLVNVTSDEAPILARQLARIEGGNVTEKVFFHHHRPPPPPQPTTFHYLFKTIERLKSQLAISAKPFEYWLAPSRDTRCVFLDQEGTCSIYDKRPLECRLWRVETDPYLCSKRATRDGESPGQRLVAIPLEMFYSAAVSASELGRPLVLQEAILMELEKGIEDEDAPVKE